MQNKEIQAEIDFYSQKLKEAKMKEYKIINERQKLSINVIDNDINDIRALYCGDTVEILPTLKSNSVHYTLFSPPFSSLYVYSNSTRDMGNCKSDEEFYNHFKLIIPELYRVTMHGRLVSFHCMQIPAMKERDGYIGLKDFRGDLIRLFQEVGFIFHSEVLVWKDPLLEVTRTKAHGLMHKQLCKDSAKCRNGLPDYIITMKKPGENPEPVSRDRGFEYYIGEKKNEPLNKKNDVPGLNKYSHNVFRTYADPIWHDIRQTNTLNKKGAREEKDERHICPLQLDTIARCIEYWTNTNDIVLSPFMGIGSEGYQAIAMNRRFIGIELKESYYKCAVKNITRVETGHKQMDLFK